MDKTLLKLCALASVSVLASCGGDGGAPPAPNPPASPAGFYVGTMGAGPTLRDVSTLILDNGRVYSLYSGPAGGPATGIAGAVVGNGVTTGNTFTASPTRDFNFEAPASVTIGSLSASFTPRSSISGTVSGSVPSVAFTGTYSPAYENAPSLAALAGTYAGDVGITGTGSEGADVVVAPDGTVTALSDNGCNLSGTTTLHASGNVYDVTITVGAGCIPSLPPGTVFTGHAYLNGNVLHSIVMNPGLTEGLIFSGTR
ncbi:hypothetical protein [Hydrogenophaga sp.]|uniref:hypothetical protein n=1 Tax=Hydrogenophaga sp. TaxID=1904254 RepID=UPI003F72E080